MPLGTSTTPLILSYVDVLCAHQDIIANLFFGHTHSDEFHVMSCPSKTLSNQHDDPYAVMFITSSITTYGGHIPSWRVLKYNKEDKVVVDYAQRSMDLAASNLKGEGVWDDLYQATVGYKISDLRPANMRTLALNMITDDNIWNLYRTVSAGGPGGDMPTDRLTEACQVG